jgi:hypothetical protein
MRYVVGADMEGLRLCGDATEEALVSQQGELHRGRDLKESRPFLFNCVTFIVDMVRGGV